MRDGRRGGVGLHCHSGWMNHGRLRRSFGRASFSAERRSQSEGDGERAGCCQCAKEYQVVRAHSGFNSGTVASCDGCRRLMFEFYTGMHTSLRLLSSFLNMSPLCASEGRAAGVGPKDRLGRRQRRKRGGRDAGQRSSAGGRAEDERASVLQTPTAAGTTATAAHGLFSPDRPTERPTAGRRSSVRSCAARSLPAAALARFRASSPLVRISALVLSHARCSVYLRPGC